MRVSPALPWGAATERGVIRLNKYVSQQDLLDGILKWTVSDQGSDYSAEIIRDSDNKLVLEDGNGQLMYEIADFDNLTKVLELTRVPDSSESLLSVEFPAVIAPQGDVQVFADRFGYKLATGTLSKVYVRVNKPWVGEDSGWTVGPGPSDEGKTFQAEAPNYGINLWIDWNSISQLTPYSEGQMVEVSYGAGDSLDITGFDTMFSKPQS